MTKIVNLTSRLPLQDHDVVTGFRHVVESAAAPSDHTRNFAQASFAHLLNFTPQLAPFIAAALQIVVTHDPNHYVRANAQITGRDLQKMCGDTIIDLTIPNDPSLERLKTALEAMPMPPQRRKIKALSLRPPYPPAQ